jgi:hypothetical protein
MTARRVFARLLLAAVLLCMSAVSRGETGDAGDFGYVAEASAHLAAGRPDLALQALRAVEDQYSQDPGFNYLLGGVAMRAEAWGEALNALERLVLQQPGNAGAWLDMAIASYHLGDTHGARQLFDYVEQNFQPPQPVREVIAAYRMRMAAAEAVSGFSGEVIALAGHDSNVNGGISARSLPLTFGEQIIEFELDRTSWPRGDFFGQVEAGLRYNAPPAAGPRLGALLQTQVRNYRQENDFDTRQVLVGAGLQGETGAGRLNGWLYQRESRLGGNSFLDTRLATLGLERPWRNCRASLGAEAETRRYPTLSILDANTAWLAAGVQCVEDAAGSRALQWLAQARIGDDRPLGDRAGGRQSRQELQLVMQRPLPYSLRLEGSLFLARQSDAEGYSHLIEGGRARRLLRAHARLALARPIAPALEVLVVAEWTQQQSNLALFEQRGQMLALGLRAAF